MIFYGLDEITGTASLMEEIKVNVCAAVHKLILKCYMCGFVLILVSAAVPRQATLPAYLSHIHVLLFAFDISQGGYPAIFYS